MLLRLFSRVTKKLSFLLHFFGTGCSHRTCDTPRARSPETGTAHRAICNRDKQATMTPNQRVDDIPCCLWWYHVALVLQVDSHDDNSRWTAHGTGINISGHNTTASTTQTVCAA